MAISRGQNAKSNLYTSHFIYTAYLSNVDIFQKIRNQPVRSFCKNKINKIPSENKKMLLNLKQLEQKCGLSCKSKALKN